MNAVARIGDTSSHGGHIISCPVLGQTADGIQVAMIGSLHSCPIPGHGTTPIVSSPITTVEVEGNTIAMVGSIAACGAVIITGSPTVKVV